jgi:hypothetical protein
MLNTEEIVETVLTSVLNEPTSLVWWFSHVIIWVKNGMPVHAKFKRKCRKGSDRLQRLTLPSNVLVSFVGRNNRTHDEVVTTCLINAVTQK